MEKMGKILDEQVRALVKSGYYSNKGEVMRFAIRNLFQTRGELRMLASINLYKEGKISLGKAAELAGMNIIVFKEALGERGIIREIGESEEELRKRTKKLKQLIAQKAR